VRYCATGGIEATGKMKPDSTMNGNMMNMTVCCACWRVCETSEMNSPSATVVSMNRNSPSTTTHTWPWNGTRNHSRPTIATIDICTTPISM